MDELKLSVTQLNEYVNGLLTQDVLLSSICVRGEVSGFKRHSSGHLYFSLKDDNAVLRCVMFRQSAQHVSFNLRDGLQILAHGSVKLYVQGGQFQLYVQSMEQEGDGELYRRFALLKTRLAAQGLFDEVKKKTIPLLPKCLGVVTSQTGAALQDIIQITRRRFPNMPILLYPAKVQGEGAAGEIAAGIRALNRLGTPDVLIVGRGGGSIEDLWAFNEEAVARAIYESRIPVVSAVGHETDFSIADFTADLRAPTPSAAAELCVPEYDALAEQIEAMRGVLLQNISTALAARRKSLEALRASAGFAQPGYLMQSLKRDMKNRELVLTGAIQKALGDARYRQSALSEQLAALSPQRVLGRGYAMVQNMDGRYVSSLQGLAMDAQARLHMVDGSAIIRIESKEEQV